MRYQLLLALFALSLIGCKKNDKDNVQEYVYTEPAHFPTPVYKAENNPYDPVKFSLGRKLFYDPILSSDNSISCGSCHKPFVAFADIDHALSHGIDDQFTKRNSPGIFNIRWNPSFMWDGGINHIEVMPIAPITNPVEMNQDLKSLVNELQQHPKYSRQFKNTFGTDSITSQQILLALAQFMSQLVSDHSKYDDYIKSNKKKYFDNEELAGEKLFEQHCASCHAGVLQTDFSFRNNGFVGKDETDKGRYLITLKDEDINKFKVPSLRNIELTGPYMHDGSAKTLDEVIDHYRFNAAKNISVDPLLVKGINITDEEKNQLLKFLYTLTDREFINNPLFKEVR